MPKKILHIEVLRILAVLCIMYSHTGFRGHDAYSCTDSTVTFMASLALACVSTCGVELFWMISGSLLLDGEECAREVYKKRVIRFLKVLLIFSLIRYFYDWFMGVYGTSVYWGDAYGVKAGAGQVHIGVWDFFIRFISGSIFVPYWFLYYFIGILILLPFIRKLFRAMTMDEWRLLLLLEFIFLVVVEPAEIVLHTHLEIPFYVPGPVNSFILGYAAEKVISGDALKKSRNLVLIACVVVTVVLFKCIVTIMLGNPIGADRIVYTEVCNQPIAFCVLLLARGLALKLGECPKRMAKIICYIGGCTFGIYLLEDYLRQLLAFIDDDLTPILTVMPACIVWIVCSYVAGIIVVGALKILPGLKKLI